VGWGAEEVLLGVGFGGAPWLVQGDALVDGEVGERCLFGRGELAQDGGPEALLLRGGHGGQQGGPRRRGEAAAGEEHHGLVDDPALGGAGQEELLGAIGGDVGAELVGEGLEERRWQCVQPCADGVQYWVVFRLGGAVHFEFWFWVSGCDIW
jgi:hypothetical protein